ncbi:MAG: DUF4091 domain-containing protein [Clostridiales bacterium]|nr:DUF4091 domain-containing protein [Clostridiales bacterium]
MDLLKIVSSQYKHLPGRTEQEIDPRQLKQASLLKNEPFSFQALYRAEEEALCQPVSVSARCEGLPISAWRVDFLPVLQPWNPHHLPGFESDRPGLFPDLLLPRPADPVIKDGFEKDTDNLLNAYSSDYQAVWFTVNPDSALLTPGDYDVDITLLSLSDNRVLAQKSLRLEVIDAALPEQNLYYTNWFHEDVLCDTFDVELYSEKFYEIFDDYVKNMVRHRQNTLLLPAFTPPLDTPVGSERMNVQLVDVKKEPSGWHFGFDRMRTFIAHAKACGIRYFEHSHLFSQWGASHAPNIYDREGKRIFGFDTDAAGEEYVSFIRAYLSAFFAFAKEEGIRDQLLFHISDEPIIEQLPSYRRAVETVKDLLANDITADAMSNPEFFLQGLVKQPIASVRKADDFLGRCPSLWLYYTGSATEFTNRLLSNTAAKTRVLGLMLYHYNALGFLHWGYNFYYDRLSQGRFNPHSAPNGYKIFPGAAHLCYPVFGKDVCHAAPSIREKMMQEAMDDVRALKLLESAIGREKVEALCEETLGAPLSITLTPEEDALLTLRLKINEKIKEMLS